MSYTRVQQPRTRTRNYNGKASQSSPKPTPVNRPPPDADKEREDGSTKKPKIMTDSPLEEERTLQSRGTHYVLQPNPSKNKKLKTGAQREEAAYKQHREEKREQLTSELSQLQPTPVGGQRHSQRELAELRKQQERQQQLDAKYNAIIRKQKRKEYQEATRQREDEELQKMKLFRREQAKRLEEKQQAQLPQEQEELRKKRLAYFDRKT